MNIYRRFNNLND